MKINNKWRRHLVLGGQHFSVMFISNGGWWPVETAYDPLPLQHQASGDRLRNNGTNKEIKPILVWQYEQGEACTVQSVCLCVWTGAEKSRKSLNLPSRTESSTSGRQKASTKLNVLDNTITLYAHLQPWYRLFTAE